MTKKKIIITILLIFALLITAELLANVCYYPCLNETPINFRELKLNSYKSIEPFNPDKEFYFEEDKTFDGKNNKGAISVVGCSCTYGLGLEREETFAARLNQITGRKVYSRAIWGKNIPYVYYQILHNLIPKDTEYIIYFYLPHHINNILADGVPFDSYYEQLLRYKETKNGELEQNKPLFFLRHSYIVKLLDLKKEERDINTEIQTQHILTLMFKNCVQELKKSYPNTKFVIVKIQVFEDDNHFFNPDLENLLLDSGVIILDAEKLTGEKYYLPHNKLADEEVHPNADVWVKLTPAIVKELNL